MDISIVELFQSCSNGFFDAFFSFVTKFGEIIPFVVIFFLLYWCVNNKSAMQFMCMYLIGVALNSVIKHAFKRERPYVASDKIIDKYGSSGYSFPSGHTVSATLAFGGAYCLLKEKVNKKVKIFFAVLSAVIIVLVMISRIYLGQHYLSDVLCAFLLSVLWLVLSQRIYKFFNGFEHKALLFVFPVAIMVALFSGSPFIVNAELSKIYLICGLLAGIVLGYFIDKQFIKSTGNKSALFIIIKGVVCTISTSLLIAVFVVISRHLITFFMLFMILGLLTTAGYSAISEHVNKLIIKRKRKHENL